MWKLSHYSLIVIIVITSHTFYETFKTLPCRITIHVILPSSLSERYAGEYQRQILKYSPKLRRCLKIYPKG